MTILEPWEILSFVRIQGKSENTSAGYWNTSGVGNKSDIPTCCLTSYRELPRSLKLRTTFFPMKHAMAVPNEKNYHQSVERLTNGFGALIEQVQELARKNTDLEQRLARVREEVFLCLLYDIFNPLL